MRRALELGASVRLTTSPNPWVGSVVLAADGSLAGEGATAAPGGPHAEASALASAGERARGGTCYSTLEPCTVTGRTGPCAEALIAAGVRRVVIAVADPDDRVSGRGVARLESAGVEVTTGVLAAEASEQLRPYLVHRTTLRPYVVLKLATTLDGYIAAPDGSSKWITGEPARADAHRLRAESDAVLVGAGTVRADDPQLTVRLGPRAGQAAGALGGVLASQPLRVVLGRAPEAARVRPAVEMTGDPRGVLDDLGRRGVLQLLVEGGSNVAAQFHRLGLVDRYVLYLAPALLGGADGRSMFAGQGAGSMAEAWRGRLVGVLRLGEDIRVDVEATGER